MTGFSGRTFAHIALKLHKAGVDIREGVVTIVSLMQASTSKNLSHFIELAIKLGGYTI